MSCRCSWLRQPDARSGIASTRSYSTTAARGVSSATPCHCWTTTGRVRGAVGAFIDITERKQRGKATASHGREAASDSGKCAGRDRD